MLRALLLLVRKSHSQKVRRKFNGVCPYGRILTYETVLIGDSLDPPFLTDLATDFCVFRKSRNRLFHIGDLLMLILGFGADFLSDHVQLLQ